MNQRSIEVLKDIMMPNGMKNNPNIQLTSDLYEMSKK